MRAVTLHRIAGDIATLRQAARTLWPIASWMHGVSEDVSRITRRADWQERAFAGVVWC